MKVENITFYYSTLEELREHEQEMNNAGYKLLKHRTLSNHKNKKIVIGADYENFSLKEFKPEYKNKDGSVNCLIEASTDIMFNAKKPFRGAVRTIRIDSNSMGEAWPSSAWEIKIKDLDHLFEIAKEITNIARKPIKTHEEVCHSIILHGPDEHDPRPVIELYHGYFDV